MIIKLFLKYIFESIEKSFIKTTNEQKKVKKSSRPEATTNHHAK